MSKVYSQKSYAHEDVALLSICTYTDDIIETLFREV